MVIQLPILDSALTCVVVEDQRMFLELLVGMLRTLEGLAVLATARTAAEGIAACRSHRPDLLILDLGLPDQGGEVVAEALAVVNPQARVIVLSAQASSFVCPAHLCPHLHAVIDKIDAYQTLGIEITQLLQSRSGCRIQLTARERELLLLLGSGLSNLRIAELMHISVHTVETHRRNLITKLGIKGAELIHYATIAKLQSGS
jgi:DNA-binding NarL/FixJ family response regulator